MPVQLHICQAIEATDHNSLYTIVLNKTRPIQTKPEQVRNSRKCAQILESLCRLDVESIDCAKKKKKKKNLDSLIEMIIVRVRSAKKKKRKKGGGVER